MGTGQSLLTIGALMMISIIILNFYRISNGISSTLDFSRFHMEGLSILTSHIEQLSQYFFDEVSTNIEAEKSLDMFTSPANLGVDPNDQGIIDDIDDLNQVTLADTGISGVIYHIHYDVDYVMIQGDSIVHSNVRQYHKRVTISVCDAFNPPMIYTEQGSSRVRDTLRISTIISYWFYN